MVGGASLSWIFVVMFLGGRSREFEVLRSCKDLPRRSRPPNALRLHQRLSSHSTSDPRWYWEKNTLQTHLCTTHKKNTHPLLQQLFPNFSFCPLTKKPTITPDRTHRHHVCA
jgi:hypothetical protein